MRFVSALVVLLLSLLVQHGACLQLVDQRLQLKTGNMLGSVGVSIAQWDLEFDEDLFYWETPPCAPGLTRDGLTAADVAANPCWAGCDFTSSDPEKCGKPLNSSDPTCQTICNNHPNKAVLCNSVDRPWHVLQPDEESLSFNVTIGEKLLFRANWLSVEQGFRLDALPSYGQVALFGVALMDGAALIDGGSYCVGFDSPDPYANVCPSFQCFYYGTWEFVVVVGTEQTLDDYSVTSSVFLRSFAPPDDEDQSVRRTQPRPDAPVSFPESLTPYHVPLQFGVTVDAYFPPLVPALFYQLTTPYCGLISVLHEKAVWDRLNARVAIGVSTDPLNPFPVSVSTDILFVDGSIKPLWVCPTGGAHSNVTVFIAVARYTATGDPPLSNAELHYFTVDYYRPTAGWKQYRLGNDSPSSGQSSSSSSSYSRYTSFPPLANWGTGLAANLFRLRCPNPASPTVFEYLDCRAGSSFFGTCLQFLFGVPVDPWTISLLPVPNVIRDANPEGFGNIGYTAFPSTASRRLSAFLILETSVDGALLTQTLGANWSALWSQCVLELGSDSPITSAEGEWLVASLALQPTQPECVYEEFKQLSEEITAAIALMTDDSFSAYSERVQIDELTFHDPWQACADFIAEQLSTRYSTDITLYGSVACLDAAQGSDDPCCNVQLAWTQCCAPRDLSATVTALELDSNATAATCRFAGCVDSLLDEYYRALLNDQLGGCAGPDLQSRLRAPIRAYRDCREAAFGDDFDLPSCVVDADCTSMNHVVMTNTTSYCNQVTKQCVFDFESSVDYFFDCLAASLPIEARIKLIALNGWSGSVSTDAQLSSLLHEEYGRSSQCVDAAFGSPWSLNNAHLETGSIFPGCQVCTLYATDVSQQTPPWCEVRSASTCTYLWSIASSELGCDAPVCNWQQQEEDCDTSQVGSFFCGVCESDAVCTEVDSLAGITSRSECEAVASVCFLADGSVRTDLTEQQCTQDEQYATCTLPCGSEEAACQSQTECEATGYCEPDDAIYEAMAGSPWFEAAGEATGFCAVPLSPFNSPDCSSFMLGSLPSSYGCVVYGDCTADASELTCTPNYNSRQSCQALPGAQWWPRFGDRDSCLRAYGCEEELVGMRSLSSLGTRLRSPKTDVQCSLCGGELQPLAAWHAGRWLSGNARRSQWIERALVSRYRLADSIDFNALYNDIYASSRAAVAFQLQNNIQCSYQTLNGLVDTVSCSCTSSSSSSSEAEPTRSDCFVNGFITSVGRGQACPLTSNTIIAPPAKLSYQEDGVSSRLQDQCVEFAIDRINARFFYGEAPPPISTGFVPTFTVRGWNAVVNDNGALVGQIIGDGVDLHFERNGGALETLHVCLLISSSYIPLAANDEPFSVYSLGYWTGNTEPATVVPYTAAVLTNVTASGGYVCGTVALHSSSSSSSDVSFVPIYRRADWQDQPSARFSDGQLALLYIVASFFAILCFAIVVQLGRLIAVGAWRFAVATNYIWILLFFMTVIRAVYIYLVAADVLGQQNQHLLVDFWMMDLPTLLYLIVNSTIAMSFLFLLLASKNDLFQRKLYFWVTLLLLVSFIVAIFVAILLAFNYAVVSSQGAHGPALCSTFTDNSDAARAIRITYECLLFAIALFIAVIAGAIAAKLWWDLRDQDGTSSLLALGTVSSFGILSDSLAFLIYYIVNDPTPYFAIVLIFTEILPITFLVARVSTRQIKNQQRSNDTSGRPRPHSSSGSDGHSGVSYTRSREGF